MRSPQTHNGDVKSSAQLRLGLSMGKGLVTSLQASKSSFINS